MIVSKRNWINCYPQQIRLGLKKPLSFVFAIFSIPLMEKQLETYNASVSETNPESMYINQSTVNHEMRKANRAQCRKDRDEFEELAYSIQDEIISKVATAKED